MAVWKVTKHDGNVKLVYQCDGAVKECGSGPEVLEADLLAWVADSATPWDIIAIEGGGWFVRLGAAFVSA